ncbi:MAG: putative toxin-antitoxin system toxin component, PIN family [Candidatus Electrothrix sp. Rat3]|nr:putative toxin-antitoxin system toxin component, PIN family [Candidatus Electrothrix rattekaaiensis]
MRIVLDTNVFISAIFFGGPPSEILTSWKHSQIQIIFTKEILEEYQRVGKELSVKYPSVNIEPILELFTIFGEFVGTEGIKETICEDPDDNKFIECAIASGSKLIVSGDKHLLNISGYKRIEVLKPREFVDAYLE